MYEKKNESSNIDCPQLSNQLVGQTNYQTEEEHDCLRTNECTV